LCAASGTSPSCSLLTCATGCPTTTAWFILDVVDQLDLDPFYRPYRADGHGHPAYDPKLLLGVLLYAYAIGVRSSRQIEQRCHEDIAFRVLAANQAPDHVTIARFRARHEQALACRLLVGGPPRLLAELERAAVRVAWLAADAPVGLSAGGCAVGEHRPPTRGSWP
jgi:Transposase domain (DUF772)